MILATSSGDPEAGRTNLGVGAGGDWPPCRQLAFRRRQHQDRRR